VRELAVCAYGVENEEMYNGREGRNREGIEQHRREKGREGRKYAEYGNVRVYIILV